MKALLYEARRGEETQIVDYGVRLERRAHYRSVLGHVINHALEQKDIARAGVVAQFLASYDPAEKQEGRHFDITLTEARFARDALALSPKLHEKKIALELRGRINAEHVFMMGLHIEDEEDPKVAEMYAQGVGFVSIQVEANEIAHDEHVAA